MTLFKAIFSFSGRMNRAGYLGINLGYLIVFVVLGALFQLLSPVGLLDDTPSANLIQVDILFVGVTLLYLTSALCYIWMVFATSVKRLHDRDKSGWWLLLSFIPIIGAIWWLVAICCLRGTDGANRFGQDPSVKN